MIAPMRWTFKLLSWRIQDESPAMLYNAVIAGLPPTVAAV